MCVTCMNMGVRHVYMCVHAGVINESSEFVRALVENAALQEEFLRLVVAPHQRGNLDKLVNYVSAEAYHGLLVS